ncbi:hypothetical protein DL766_001459 [Monosporascus sp. MC13-8B]|uniref:Zn(2)-C6 fungal-type domain-containing protein n=1 Tax=Monosporascus cannonballus TaxID=155416 RepID=A0ABY0HEN4_9PEZI|nr:hypothetical protein DL762_003095 [Monosporascus cannonballus]RYP00460.1 hypothetical protein DL763_000812 [Monosporascus cannonballus]RYP37643.1 hypothetical protein DL766_001459 [Monosporascus sp. MC13-8B]
MGSRNTITMSVLDHRRGPNTVAKRKRLPGQRTESASKVAKPKKETRKARSCQACRAGHVKCVSQGPGAPCVRCAKKAIDCCPQLQHGQQDRNSTAGFGSKPNIINAGSPEARKLRKIAIAVEAYLAAQDYQISNGASITAGSRTEVKNEDVYG